MADLSPYPFGRLVSRVLREVEAGGAILDLPARSRFLGDPSKDFSTFVHGRRVSSPLGPAAGPHTQLAQNIIMSWLAGARVFELKTVQVLDRLRIPRPCIDMRTVGYNVEWSQELTLEQSLEEYVKASMLIDILRESEPGLAPGFRDSVLDMSLGYDLAGLKSERVRAFVDGLKSARPMIDRLRHEIPQRFGRYRSLEFTERVSGTVTVSTFHGCPPSEIEAMADFLMSKLDLDVTIKLNPTLLGREEVERVLNGALGYEDVRVPAEAFEKDARWDQVQGFVERLELRARELGRSFGVKFSNTLVVENPGDFLPGSEKTRYLSGAPLHVLATRLVARFRRRFGDRMPVSFSAGVDRGNFPDAVSLGLVPVTVCSDLLKPGGYGRLKGYYEELSKRMDAVGAKDLPGFARAAWGAGGESASEAALRNTEIYAATAGRDKRYARAKNSSPPKRVGTRLALFDCLACDKCLSACPNGANFAFRPLSTTIPGVRLVKNGSGWERKPGEAVVLTKGHQIGNFADFCNECGNCDVFCPEEGGPYKSKPRFHGSLESWRQSPNDGFFLAREDGGETAYGRFEGRELVLHVRDGLAECRANGLRVFLPLDELSGPAEGVSLAEADLTPFLIMDALRKAVLLSDSLNYVNA